MANKALDGKLQSFVDWVNADRDLPTIEELEALHGHHDEHEAHEEYHEISLEDDIENYEIKKIPMSLDQAPTTDDADFIVETSELVKTDSEKKNFIIKIMAYWQRALSVVLVIVITGVLVGTVSNLPAFGSIDNPAINEVYTRYVDEGVSDTGSINLVTGMILEYRAFDTLGESVMLFSAMMGVVAILYNGSIKAKGGKK